MSDLGYLLRALLGKPDVELNNAQVRAEGDAMMAQSRYNQWRRKTGRIPVDYNRVRSIVAGERTSPLLNHPVNYNDPADVWRAHKNMMDYTRIVGAEANPNEKAYRNKEIAPRDKATMDAPLVPKMPEPRNLPKPEQTKTASEEYTMITYTQAYEMRKQAASQYENERARTISSAESKARATGVKPLPRAEAEKVYDKNRADAAKKRIEEDRAKRKAENERREAARLAERQKHLNNSRYLNSQYGSGQKAQLQGQLDKQKEQYAARTAPKNTSTQVVAKGSATKSTVSSPVRVANAAKKRAPGIYNAQGQKWNGSAFV